MKSLNSYGTRGLINAVRELHSSEIKFYNCPVFFAHTFNVVKAILGPVGSGKNVVSFFAPFSFDDCELCDGKTQDILITADEVIEGVFPEKSCSQCRKTLEPEESADEFLQFLEY